MRRVKRCEWPLLHGPLAALCAPRCSEAGWEDRPDPETRELEALARAYHSTIRPHDWHRTAQREPWGLRRGDILEVVGYGASRGFAEALIVRRVGDGAQSLVFPSELAPADQPMAHGGPSRAAGPATCGAGSETLDSVVEAAEESFPASDPPSWVPVRLGRLRPAA